MVVCIRETGFQLTTTRLWFLTGCSGRLSHGIRVIVALYQMLMTGEVCRLLVSLTWSVMPRV
jgi:hypothetical protein